MRFFLVGRTPLRENEGRVSKTGFFLRFGGPETVLKTVLTIRFVLPHTAVFSREVK